MRERLSDYIGTIQLMESYSIGFLSTEKPPVIEHEGDAYLALCELTERFQLLNAKSDLLSYIDKEDLNAIAHFLSDKCSRNEDWTTDD